MRSMLIWLTLLSFYYDNPPMITASLPMQQPRQAQPPACGGLVASWPPEIHLCGATHPARTAWGTGDG